MRFRTTIRKEGAPDETRVIEAASRFAVYESLQKEGGHVVLLEEAGEGFRLPSWLFVTIGTGVKRQEVIRMAKDLAAMLSAGLSLARGLAIIETQTHNKHFKKVITELTASLTKGAALSAGLEKFPHVFPPVLIAMVRAGEESGNLSGALITVATQLERSEELAKKVKGAMIYPTIVISAVIVVGVLMLIYVVPTLTKTFESLHVQVPLATRIIVAISGFMSANALLTLAAVAAFFAACFAFARSEKGSAIILWAALRVPAIGELVRETYSARFARTLSSLLSAGVPILGALAITKEVVRAPAFARVITEAEGAVKKGESMSSVFSKHAHLYPVMLGGMLAVGEETGKLAEMLKQVAVFYEEDVAEKTKDLSAIIEPVLMLVIGAGVGVFAVAIISPIYSLSSAI